MLEVATPTEAPKWAAEKVRYEFIDKLRQGDWYLFQGFPKGAKGRKKGQAVMDAMPNLTFRAVVFEGTHYVAIKCDSDWAYDEARGIGLWPVSKTVVSFDEAVTVVVDTAPTKSERCRDCKTVHSVPLSTPHKWFICPECLPKRQAKAAAFQAMKEAEYAGRLSRIKNLEAECIHGMRTINCARCY